MVFAGVLMGQNAPSLVELPFAGGDQSVTNLQEIMQTMANSLETGTNATTGGNLTIGGVDYTTYDYNILPDGETISSGYTDAKYWTATHDRAALLAFKGDLTIDTTFEPSHRKIFTCMYIKGNLNMNAVISMAAPYGGNQHNKGFGQTNPTTAMPITSTYSLSTTAAGGGGAGGTSGGRALNPGGRGMFSGGGGGSKSGNSQYGGYHAQSYGGQGAGDGWASGCFGGGAGNGGGQRGGSGGSAQSRGSAGVGGTLIIFLEGTITVTGAPITEFVAYGAAGGSANGFSGQSVPACGGGGSGGGNVVFIYSGSGTAPAVSIGPGAGGQAQNGGYTATNGFAGQAGTYKKISTWTP